MHDRSRRAGNIDRGTIHRARRAEMLDIAWWDWPREILQTRFDEFADLDSMLAKYGK